MKFDLSYLIELKEKIISNDCFFKKKKRINKSRKTKGYYYQFYNQLCACIIRISETVGYLEEFKFRKENHCGQAFDFYEFINCISIIKVCTDVLFKTFDEKLDDAYPHNRAFKISNRSKTSDISFFNFIRSAVSMHPTETTAHNKITKHEFEVYPYVIWINEGFSTFKKNMPKEAELEVLSWNCKTEGKNKYYYLVITEFFSFVENLLGAVKNLIPVASAIVEEYKDKMKCKRLKSPANFSNMSDYCLYLRKRIHLKLTNKEFPDGGLLLASHLMVNELIGVEFKDYVKNRIQCIVNKMTSDITTIEYNEIFEELNLDTIICGSDSHYVSEKFYDYLYREAICEIEKNNFVEFKNSIRYEKNNCNYSNREWSVILLLSCKDERINKVIEKASTYCDLYELILELIYSEQ